MLIKNFLSIQNLSIGYKLNKKEKIISEKINLTAQKNETIALIGRNGIGKSTLLRTIAGIQDSLIGQINIQNKNITNYSRKQLSRKISFVSPTVINVPNLKIHELIALGRFPHTNWLGKIQQKDKKIINTAIKLTETEKFSNKNIDQISDGERQRVMFARAIAQDTDIIFLDEPTAFLDIESKHHLVYILKNLSRKKNKLIIFSTHDLNIAIKHADKIWLMLDNKVITGAPEDLILNNSFNSIFQNQNIKFDNHIGDFNLINSKFKNINLINNSFENLYYFWTKNALNRNGYKIHKNSEQTIYINKKNNTFTWKYNQNSYNSIYKLLSALDLPPQVL